MVKKIETKQVENVRYELVFFEGDHVYVIYKWDSSVIEGTGTQLIPEVGRFSLEKDARDCLDSLT